MTPLELASGAVFGHDHPYRSRPSAAARSARGVLEDLVADALRAAPCVVAFSGGRDSSAMLALAVHVARRRGLPTPVPVTRRYVGDADADEAGWQEMVVRHLGLNEWVRLTITDQCDLLGPLAATVLRRFGVLWPPTAHVLLSTTGVCNGGALLTGEGGDEVFGPHRVTPVRHLAGGRRRRRAAVPLLASAIGPRATRAAAARRVGGHRHWLTSDAAAAVERARVRHELDEPLSWRRATLRLADRRGWRHGATNLALVAGLHDVALHHPLLNAAFLDAYAAHGSLVGPLTRAAAMRALFGDLLPDAVLRRTSKATFNTTLFGPASRQFVAGWTGTGVATDLVDAERLTAAWCDPVPDGRTFALLQSAWLARVPPSATRPDRSSGRVGCTRCAS